MEQTKKKVIKFTHNGIQYHADPYYVVARKNGKVIWDSYCKDGIREEFLTKECILRLCHLNGFNEYGEKE